MNNTDTKEPTPPATVSQPDNLQWPLTWKQEGFNHCMLQASAALTFLASNDRPAMAGFSFNAEHLLQLARELNITQKALLSKNAPAPDGDTTSPTNLNVELIAKLEGYNPTSGYSRIMREAALALRRANSRAAGLIAADKCDAESNAAYIQHLKAMSTTLRTVLDAKLETAPADTGRADSTLKRAAMALKHLKAENESLRAAAIAHRPEVEETIHVFADNQTEENAVAIVNAVLAAEIQENAHA